MTQHLLAIELGPLVDFISASRKTRDVWFSSWLFSELAKAVARKVAEECGGVRHLIFPAPTIDQLAAESDFTVGDIVLAIVPEEKRPSDVAAQAKKAAHEHWLAFARETQGDLRPGDIEHNQWKAQTPDQVPAGTAGEVIECYSAWVPLDGDYQQARLRLMRLLQARNLTRNFPGAPGNSSAAFHTGEDDQGIWKSSLDGRRPNVLLERRSPTGQRQRDQRLRLTEGEKLDVGGLVKRLWGGKRNYPSTARLAADPWIRGAARNAPEKLRDLVSQCETLAKQKFVGRVDTETYPHFAAFPYEGAALYESRHAELVEENECPEEAFSGLRECLQDARRELGAPSPYYGILVADGDHVGAALEQIDSASKHQKFSREMAEFAGRARGLICKHQGAPIYVGGDDVVAFLPLDQCLECADQLRMTFAGVWPGITMSVGIVIWHFLDSLEEGLQAGRMAEHLAKTGTGTHDERNSLAICYSPRGGAPITFRRRWDTNVKNDLDKWIRLLTDGSLPNKVAYDLRATAQTYEAWSEPATLVAALRSDLLRLMSGKSSSVRRELNELLVRVSQPQDVIDLANTIIIARHIADAKQMTGGGDS